MEIMEILKDAVKYPFSDIKTLLIIGIIFLVVSLCGSLGQFQNDALVALGGLISLILGLILAGYSLDVIKLGTELNDAMPALDIKENIMNGIKLLIVTIVYYIIPVIILAIVSIFAGGYALMSLSNITLAQNAAPAEVLSTVMTPEMITGLGIIAIVGIILGIIFGLLALMGQARLAKTGDIGNAVSFGQSIEDLKTIGVGKTLALIILIYILLAIIAAIFMFIAMIPIVGIILLALFGESIMMFIQYRAYGLLYSEIA